MGVKAFQTAHTDDPSADQIVKAWIEVIIGPPQGNQAHEIWRQRKIPVDIQEYVVGNIVRKIWNINKSRPGLEQLKLKLEDEGEGLKRLFEKNTHIQTYLDVYEILFPDEDVDILGISEDEASAALKVFGSVQAAAKFLASRSR